MNEGRIHTGTAAQQNAHGAYFANEKTNLQPSNYWERLKTNDLQALASVTDNF